MLQSVKGYYEHGMVVLDEQPDIRKKFSVIVTFIAEEPITESKTITRKLGGLEGKIFIPDDFDEPLDDLKEYMY